MSDFVRDRVKGHQAIVLLAVALLLLAPSMAAVTGQSLWMDEAASCYFADHARLFQLVQLEGIRPVTVAQMPGFHLLLTIWVRVFGDSERALRAINLPFAALFIGSIVLLCRRAGRYGLCLAIPFSVFPLLIYYVNECRPYAALLGLSTAATASLLLHIESPSRRTAWCCCAFSLAAAAMHVLGILTLIVLMAFIFLQASVRRQLMQGWRSWAPALGTALPCYATVLTYYVHSAKQGVHYGRYSITNPSTPGNIPSNWKNIVAFLYEVFGFSGLGPPRNALRVHMTLQTFSGYLFSLSLGVIACCAIAVILIRKVQSGATNRGAVSLLWASLIGLLFLFVIARMSHFGFFGRHGIAIAGSMCCALILALGKSRATSAADVALICLLSLLWGVSSARLLFLYPYAKDDDRAALEVARALRRPVFWNGDSLGAAYYGGCDVAAAQIETVNAPHPTAHWQCVTPIHIVGGSTDADVDALVRPLLGRQCVFVRGKADIYDPTGEWDKRIARWHPRLINRLDGFDVFLVTLPVSEPEHAHGDSEP